MDAPDRLSVHRRIAAPAAAVFAAISDPRRHVEIDGSGMLMSAPDARPVQAVGDRFVMKMDREPLGDLPMGRYEVINTITTFEPDVELAWSVGSTDRPIIGHVYGYRLDVVGSEETEVTSYCDWSRVAEKWRTRLSWPVVPAHMLEKSLERLDDLLTRTPNTIVDE